MAFNYYSVLEDIKFSFWSNIDSTVLKKAAYDNKEYRKCIYYFMDDLKDMGFIFEKAMPKGLNESRYMIVYIDEENGYPIRREMCYFRYVTGIYGGCLAQLHDLRDDLLATKGVIR